MVDDTRGEGPHPVDSSLTGPHLAGAALDDEAVLSRVEDARVLVVDDNRVNRHLLSALLERGGISRIETAEDGNQALAKVEVFQPDLVLLDLMMPHLDGFEVCRQLREDGRYKDLPVLVQSSLSRAEDRAKAFAAGVTDYVTKPINAVELLSRVRIHLENRVLLNSLQLYRRRAEAELALARQMQERLLPSRRHLAQIQSDVGISLSAHFEPSSELGGDFWGLRRDGQGRLVVWLVDFSGHGVGAALNTFRLHAILKQMDVSVFDPASFLAAVNQRLCPLLPFGQFATMLAGVIDHDGDQFRYATGGTTRPLAWGPGETAPRFWESSGLPLGILPSAQYENRTLPLPAGGRLFLYSDAATELMVGDGVLDEEGLAEIVVASMGEADNDRFMERLLAGLAAVGPFDDDLTALILTRLR